MGVLRARVGGQWVDIGSGTTFTDPCPNLLDNGQFYINQRQAANTATGTAGVVARSADRWTAANQGVGGGTTIVWQTTTASGLIVPAGRPRPVVVQYLQMGTAEAAGALAAGDYIIYYQAMEGYNLQHLNYGQADAKTLTLTFDVATNAAGTYVVELISLQTAGSRSISRQFVVAAGSQMQTITLTFPGDTVNRIDADSSNRLQLQFFLTAGSTFTSGTLQSSWGTFTNANRAVGISNTFNATASNYFCITNIQLEVGSVPTQFAVNRFDDELRRCQRYYETSYPYGTAPGTASAGNYTRAAVFDTTVLTRLLVTGGQFKVEKRASPSAGNISTWSVDGTASSVSVYNNGASKLTISSFDTTGTRDIAPSFINVSTNAATATAYLFHWAASAEI